MAPALKGFTMAQFIEKKADEIKYHNLKVGFGGQAKRKIVFSGSYSECLNMANSMIEFIIEEHKVNHTNFVFARSPMVTNTNFTVALTARQLNTRFPKDRLWATFTVEEAVISLGHDEVTAG